MAEKGSEYTEKYVGGFTPEQRRRIDANMVTLKQLEDSRTGNAAADNSGQVGPVAGGEMIAVQMHSVAGEGKNKPMISFYAAAIGVMFLLFTASGSAGSLLDEAESGPLDRVLTSRVTMTTLLAGKLTFNTLLAFMQLVVMFLYGWAVFHLDFFSHIPGFLVMGLCTAFAVAAFGILLASICHTRGQLGAVSTPAHPDHVVLGWKYVPTLPDAARNAESRPFHHQRLGNRWFHKGVLARVTGDGFVAAGVCITCRGNSAVFDRQANREALGVCVKTRYLLNQSGSTAYFERSASADCQSAERHH
jgi:hypothetical protein